MVDGGLQWVGGGAALLVLVAVIAADVAYTVLRNTVPSPSGALAIAGLSAPVEVVRDREGVPHVFARTTDDLFCALGFLHAQDRLWQMELTRRAGQGRLSEIFGDRTFSTDVFLRTLDLYGHAERSQAALSPRSGRASKPMRGASTPSSAARPGCSSRGLPRSSCCCATSPSRGAWPTASSPPR